MISKASKIRAESMADRRACRSRLTGLALSEAKNNRATRNVLFKTKAILQASRRSADSWWNEPLHIAARRTGRPFVSPDNSQIQRPPSGGLFVCVRRRVNATDMQHALWLAIQDEHRALGH